MNQAPRFAVYWAPPRDHALWQAGCEWLGRDAETGAESPAPRAFTAVPRRYGFHATLRAPMQLADGVDEVAFVARVAELVCGLRPFDMPALHVDTLDGFVALRPRESVDATHPLRQWADALVIGLEPLRRPLDEAALARRLTPHAGDPQAAENIRRFGDAHVMDRWRFHMTLSDSFADDDVGRAARERVVEAARDHFADALDAPLACDAVAVFIEPARDAPLRLAHRVAWRG